MRSRDIAIGGVYFGRSADRPGGFTRMVVEIGEGIRGRAPAPGAQQVVFMDGDTQSWRYLDTFAKWAERKVTA